MIPVTPALQKLATVLMRLAVRILPSSSEDWAKAMLSEFYHRNNCKEALSWAAGCLLACFKMRIEKMFFGNKKIFRWVLGPEFIICFFPLIFTWLESLFELYWDLFLSFPDLPPPIPYQVLNTSTIILGALGPLSLFFAFRSVLLDVRLPGKPIQLVLFGGPLVLGLIYVVCWSLLRQEFDFYFWSHLIPVSVLPALAMIHLIHIYSPDNKQRTALP